jgi:hypothetical protein
MNIPEDFENHKQNAIAKMKICIQCDKFMPVTKQCSVCRCFMPVKVLIPKLHCPEDKW